MSTPSRRTVIQPRPTKASALRSSSVQNTTTTTAAPKKSSTTEPSTKKSATTTTTGSERRPAPHSNARASEGVRAFMSSQRSRLNKAKQQQPDDDAGKMKTTSGNVMTGAQRYTDDFKENSSSPNTSNLKSVIQQAKSSGRLNLSHRNLENIPDQILNMYHVDPNSIVVDFSSSGGDAWYDAVELTKFVAAYNDITIMDERIGTEFGALTLIDFRNNRLQDLPSSLVKLQHLTQLQLGYNQLDTIPKVIFQLTHLRELNLAHNQLKQLPSDIGTLDHLEILDLRNNMIGPDLPQEMEHLKALRKLHLDENQLVSLSAQLVSGWKKLDDLSITHNRLTCFVTGDSEKECHLPSLLRLDIRQNNLREMTNNLRLPKLKELLVSGNALPFTATTDDNASSSSMDYTFLQHCDELLTLDVGSNQWFDIPKVVLDLTQLQRLDIGGNQIRALPTDLGRLTNLTALTWQGNPLRSVPRNISMTELIESLRVAQISQQQKQATCPDTPTNVDENDGAHQLAKSSALSSPQLGAAHTASTEESTRPVTTTRTLNLSNQKLTELSESLISQHDSVQILQLGNNDLSSFSLIPLTRFSTTLVNLSLEKNKLTTFSLTLPDTVFVALKTLNLSNNRLRELVNTSDSSSGGGSSSSFPVLNELVLNNNALTTLPDHLTTTLLPSLCILRCNSNRLATLDPDGLVNLHVLDIGNNDIVTLPPALGLISSLRELTAYGNRFRVPQPSLLAQGTPAVMAFLKRRAGVATD